MSESRESVERLVEEALAHSEAGDDDAALEKYFKALEIDISNARVCYDIGLIYKYRGAWKESFKYNKRAHELDPEDQAACWNFGIAATALRDWRAARAAWSAYGIKLADGDGEIFGDYGVTPLRLNPADDAEVVWARRLCPARARIESLPYPESGVAFDDVVLHDGAPVGSRLDAGGREVPVFNMRPCGIRSGAYESPHGTETKSRNY